MDMSREELRFVIGMGWGVAAVKDFELYDYRLPSQDFDEMPSTDAPEEWASQCFHNKNWEGHVNQRIPSRLYRWKR